MDYSHHMAIVYLSIRVPFHCPQHTLINICGLDERPNLLSLCPPQLCIVQQRSHTFHIMPEEQHIHQLTYTWPNFYRRPWKGKKKSISQQISNSSPCSSVHRQTCGAEKDHLQQIDVSHQSESIGFTSKPNVSIYLPSRLTRKEVA